jgi:predicted membrane-bound spermidine synthase
MKRFFAPLPFLAFATGFVLMVFELAAARILAPSIGSSTYVWTSVIGIIIAALSGGYWLGGRLADQRNEAKDVAWLCLMTAFAVSIVLVIYPAVLNNVVTAIDDNRLQAVVASMVLFAPVSVLLGMISPYLVKLYVRSLETSGQSVASLSALNSIGGITGTFTAGFLLFGYMGSRETLILVVVLMVLASWLLRPWSDWKLRLIASLVVIGLSFMPMARVVDAISIDTPSAHYTIHDGVDRESGQPVRGIATGPRGTQSGIYINQPDRLLFWYTQQMARVVERAGSRDAILVLGGGTFTLPQYLARTYPESRVDVVEIDPELVEVARDHFMYTDPPNIRLIFDDARAFLNRSTDRYDVVLVDVYGDTEVPFSLVTKEYGERIRAVTKPGGVVAANMIAGSKGACGELLQALAAPYAAQFRHAQYVMRYPRYARSNLLATYRDEPFEAQGGLRPGAREPYTDNFVPAERLQQACQRQ